MTNCPNCKSPITDNFCSNCGQPTKLKRIDGHYILHEIVHVLHLEKGILYTIKELVIRPGESVKHFIAENRNRLVKPVIFVIVTSLIYTIISHWFHVEPVQPLEEQVRGSALVVIFKWIENHYGYSNIIMGMFIALWLKLFFMKYDYNFFEILILLCFTMGIGMLTFAVATIIEGLSGLHLFVIIQILSLIYSCWAIGQFYNKYKVTSYLKALSAYLLGTFVFYFMAIILGIGIDLIFR
ncbi:DUF3667 domain-containing protein [Fluviicola taffensis]|uniref:DUF3667 domain-containing protein n=1 Tax=Fluviicola taffensis (strain DSM 16823 / NCIMB 13979 / RW262) TaxID=755732 RepID=F2IA41_FLUTR|nr:DUF3667 domain-containing protein [Fluviicola taffensis]AEA45218.1 hypothetical protein Fluta_3245 [Fluviicola taffensis DSM 16823]